MIDKDGNIVNHYGTVTDITEQKQLIEDLTYQNIFDQEIIEGITDGIIVCDKNFRCLKTNKAFEEFTSSNEKQLLGKPVLEILKQHTDAEFSAFLNDALEGRIVTTDDLLWKSDDKASNIFIQATFSPLSTKSGEIQGIVVTIKDVSQRKNVENEIRASEYILNNVIDAMGDLLIITNLEGRVVQVNRAFLNTLGYSRAETNGCEFPYPWLVEEEMGRFVLWIANLRKHSSLHDFDMTFKTKHGESIAVSLSTTLLRNQLGEPIAMLNIARNISERTRLMKVLENRNRQIELINRIIMKANQTMNFREIFEIVSQEIQTLIPCDDVNIGILNPDGTSLKIYAATGRESLSEGGIIPLEKTISQFAIKERKPIIVNDFLAEEKYRSIAVYKKGLGAQLSYPITLKGKIFGTINIGTKEPYTFFDEHVEMLHPIAQQIGFIIDRILLFNKVSEDSAYIRNLLDSIDSIVYTVNNELRIQEVNKAWYGFMRDFGVETMEDYHGKALFDVLPSEPLKVMFQNIIDPILNGSVKIFSQEFVHSSNKGDIVYNITINPMVINQKVVGLVFTHNDITALKKSEAELKKSNEQLLALHEISTLVSSSREVKTMLNDAIPILQKNINAVGVIVYLLDSDKNDLILTYQKGFDKVEFPTIFHLPMSASATGQVVATKKPLYISEKVYLDERIVPTNREILKKLNLDAMALIPLVSKDKVFGALDIFYDHPHVFSEQEKQILMLVGNQLGVAIENSRLYDELRSQVDRLTVLYQLSQELTSTLNINQIFEVVHKYVKQVIPFQMFRIDLYNEKTNTKTPVLNIEKVNGEEIFVTTLSHPTSVAQGTAIENVLINRNTYQSSDKRLISIPMISKDVILGIMSVEAEVGMYYSGTHIQLLESISNLTAIALEKGRLYEETLQKSIEIEKRNKELDDFTYVVSHDLKEPLISVEGFSRILQLDYQDVIQAEGKEYLDSIVGATTRMKGLIDDLLLLSRVSRPTESFKEFSIKEILDEIIHDIEFTIKQRGVEILLPDDLPTVFGNATQVKIVFRNLIGNAIKFNKNPNPKVEIGFQNTENNHYLFYVKDNGIGIDKEFYDKIFLIFQRLHRREEYEGSGAGLAIVKKIIELHNGKVWVESELGKGSTFFFTLPKPPIKNIKG